MSVTIKLEYNHLPRLSAQLRKKASAAVRRTTWDIRDGAAIRSRVDTGNMKGGWQAEMESDLSGLVSNAVSYSYFNEVGTRNMPAQPMATPAAEAAKPAFLAAMKQIADSA